MGDRLNSTLGDLVFTAFNVLPKNLKRQSRGVSNFEYTCNRILWATREQTSMLAVPRIREDVHTFTGKKRGPYRKQNSEQENSLDKLNVGTSLKQYACQFADRGIISTVTLPHKKIRKPKVTLL